MRNNKIKLFFKQLFCDHKSKNYQGFRGCIDPAGYSDVEWYKSVCRDCGKELDVDG
jgi:hypothetical protein